MTEAIHAVVGEMEINASDDGCPRLVLAEDYEDGREMLAVALRLHGYEVFTAPNGVEAIKLVATVRPKAVISDIGMPELDGLGLARQLRLLYGPALRLIALTGFGPKKMLGKAIEAGFDFYLLKPIEGKELIPYIENPILAER